MWCSTFVWGHFLRSTLTRSTLTRSTLTRTISQLQSLSTRKDTVSHMVISRLNNVLVVIALNQLSPLLLLSHWLILIYIVVVKDKIDINFDEDHNVKGVTFLGFVWNLEGLHLGHLTRSQGVK